MRNTVCLGCGAEMSYGTPHECDRDILQATTPPLHQKISVTVKDGYLDLHTVLIRALNQAQIGKGNDRHANGQAFNNQPIMAITRRHGLGFALGQAEKKITEAHGMVRREELAAAEKEFLGAINYVAAAILRLHELEAQKGK